ncbi:hypothetical protein BH09MYX1_BH09MYX1_11610 [soil metagenome]
MRACPQCNQLCDSSHQFCPACGFPIGKVAANQEDPLIGRTLPGGFVILELIGVGGMGRVYRAEQTTLGRTVAVKIVHPHLAGEENAVARFITEARAASRLNHPNSVAVIDFGKTSDGQLYLVMEYLRGKDLARVAYEEGPLPFKRIVDVLRQVLAALSEAHHLEIIHRDLKPENIILEPVRAGGDFVKVVDFGLAKMRVEEKAPSITSPGIVCGTPEYMSPEQGRGDPLDPRSDLYAVGVIMYQLLTGRLPFEADTPTQVVLMHLSKSPPNPNDVSPERRIPHQLVSTVLKALAKEASDRYSSADDFSSHLGTAIEEIEAHAQAALATLSCTKCGAANSVKQKFCGECGAPLAPAAPRVPSQQKVVIASTPETVRENAPTSPIVRRASVIDHGGALRFAGRDEDMRWLDERRNDARMSLRAAVVVGEPGVGKSRLLKEFATNAKAAGDTVVFTQPDPKWGEVGYYALRRAIVALAGLPDDGGALVDWTVASAEAKSGLSLVFGGTKSAIKQPSLAPDQQRFAAAEALRWAFVRGNAKSGGRRVILCVDDLHAIDGASRNVFIDTIAEPPLVPSLLVLAHAAGFDARFASAQPTRTLSPLSGQVVLDMLSAGGVRDTSVMSSGRGIAPLYIEHLLRFLREQGGTPPPRLADLLALRVERLDADARRVLQAIAVTGDDATEDTVRPLLPPDTDLAKAIGDLRKSGMIDSASDSYRASHPLLREIVLSTIPAAARRELHRKAAEVCEMLGAQLEVQALHEFHAQLAFEALLSLERVSGICAARGDVVGASLALRRGLETARRELFRGEIDDPERAVVIFSRKLGENLSAQGNFADAEGVLRAALDMAGPGGPDRARVLGALAHVAHGRESNREAQAYLREALEIARKSGAHELLASLKDLERSIAV